MHRWKCQLCGHVVSSAFERNLHLLIEDHRRFECEFKDLTPDELPLTPMDQEFLMQLKVGW